MIKLDEHYVQPRLVELYDIENPHGEDTDFYIRLAADLDAHRILDLGCGTGLLTRQLAVDGRHVTGIDPAPAMLAVARRQPHAERVQWVQGDSTMLGRSEADLVLMTSHVAQVFLDEQEWRTTLRDIHAALCPGGYLAFESRNPDDRAWERWNREATYEQIDSPYGPMECWVELVNVANGRVSFKGYNVFSATDEVVVVNSELRFRTLAELTDSLSDAGFTVEHVYGDWDGGPMTSTSRVMVIIARRD